MRVCLLASGSKGNAVYIESGESRILIDAGLSARELSKRLGEIGAGDSGPEALFLTHEHQDHCRGAGPVARKFRLPVYVHPDTRRAIRNLGRIETLNEFDVGDVIHFRDLEIRTFPLTHDAASPVGYTIESREGKVGIATDLGIATRLVADRLKGSRVLVLESNHDEDMLRDGPYPWPLKQRIRSQHGHLSNEASSRLLRDLLWEGLEGVFLAHLSEVNNCPDRAVSHAREVLVSQNRCHPSLTVGTQHQASICVDLL